MKHTPHVILPGILTDSLPQQKASCSLAHLGLDRKKKLPANFNCNPMALKINQGQLNCRKRGLFNRWKISTEGWERGDDGTKTRGILSKAHGDVWSKLSSAKSIRLNIYQQQHWESRYISPNSEGYLIFINSNLLSIHSSIQAGRWLHVHWMVIFFLYFQLQLNSTHLFNVRNK